MFLRKHRLSEELPVYFRVITHHIFCNKEYKSRHLCINPKKDKKCRNRAIVYVSTVTQRIFSGMFGSVRN